MSVRAACVIGWPVAHSRSPLIHGYWIKQHKLAADYRREALEPEAVADFFANLSARGYVGCNVTLPHKEAALAASEPDDRARAVGAANTLWLDDGRLLSTNTDVEGFTNNLDAAVPNWDRGRNEAVVLGAGGSARAVIYGLIERGFSRIHVVNRTFDRAQALRERFGAAVQPANWTALPHLLSARRASGQHHTARHGRPGAARHRSGAAARARLWWPTWSMRRLKPRFWPPPARRGLATADGLGMLLHQAVRGFSLWFGVRPQVTPELRALIEADLAQPKE